MDDLNANERAQGSHAKNTWPDRPPSGSGPSAPPNRRPAAVTSPDELKPEGRKHITLKLTAALLALGLIGAGSFWYWRNASLYPSTTDAYTSANTVRIAPLVGGRVVEVPVHDFQAVKAGDILVRLDPRPLRAALDGAEARLELARQKAATAQAAVTSAKAHLAEARAKLVNIQKQTGRVLTLAGQGDASKAARDGAQANLAAARSGVAAANADLQQAERTLGKPGDANANVKAATAAVATAKLDLEHGIIRAPVDGYVGEVDIKPGAVVSVGMALFPLVDSSAWWVKANFKETDLARIKPGQRATVTLDMYPSRPIDGRVTEISPASGAAFSLLPPENATGNWVKVTQRFPVRVRLASKELTPKMRIGASAGVTIDTVSGAQAGLLPAKGSDHD